MKKALIAGITGQDGSYLLAVPVATTLHQLFFERHDVYLSRQPYSDACRRFGFVLGPGSQLSGTAKKFRYRNLVALPAVIGEVNNGR
jgi:hypothetical protein